MSGHVSGHLFAYLKDEATYVFAAPRNSARGQRPRTHVVERTIGWDGQRRSSASLRAVCGATPSSGFQTEDDLVKASEVCPRCIAKGVVRD